MSKRKHQAINASRMNAFLVDPDELVIIGLDTDDGPEHPLYDPRVKRPLVESKILNVMKYGVKETIVVRKDGERVLVIDGRTRVRWARQAKERQLKAGEEPIRVPCSVVRCDDEEAHDLMVCLNEVRELEDPIERAKKMQRFADRGRTADELAVVFGCTKATIDNTLKLLDLAPEVQRKVSSGEIGQAEGSRLAKLPRAEQAKAAAARVEAKATGEKPQRLPGEAKKRPSKRDILHLAEQLGHGSEAGAVLLWSVGEEISDASMRKAIEKHLETGAALAKARKLETIGSEKA